MIPHCTFYFTVFRQKASLQTMETSLTEGLSPVNITATMTPAVSTNLSQHSHAPLLDRLAHLDEGLYNDFYCLWIGLLVVNTLIFMIGMVLNILALYVFCCRTKPMSTSVIYTINLAVTDLLVSLSLPTRIILYYSGGKCLNCSYVHIFSYFVNMYCSILFLTSICVDRYLAIVQVEASRKWRNPSVAKVVCVCIWLFAIVVTYSLLTTAFKQSTCCQSKLFALTIFEFFVPMVIIVVFTVRIMCALANPGLMQQSRERRMRAVQLLTTVLVIFTICFTPFHVRQVLVYFYPDLPHHIIVYHVTVTLSSLNSCLDPVVYCFVTNNFQSTMKRFFRRAEAELTSGDIISMQKSSKGSGIGTVTASNMMMTNLNSPRQENLRS
ncbi:G-protein coupled receptor 20 [Chanos chanos]|uniref:G-protein coupled receptor 20 n=1 Tax=Chanos chanos TaxID=29144 RepID=A0A6J2W4A8_CHACN|nr:G-protein coupled receptor 20-like [Chanos chanos]